MPRTARRARALCARGVSVHWRCKRPCSRFGCRGRWVPQRVLVKTAGGSGREERGGAGKIRKPFAAALPGPRASAGHRHHMCARVMRRALMPVLGCASWQGVLQHHVCGRCHAAASPAGPAGLEVGIPCVFVCVCARARVCVCPLCFHSASGLHLSRRFRVQGLALSRC